MTKEMVWVSRVLYDSTLFKGFESDVHLENDRYAVDAMRRNKKGEPLAAERFPKELYGKYPDKKIKKLPDISLSGGFLLISKPCAEVLRAFNLGKTSLYQTTVYEHDRKTHVEGDYFCLSIGETKKCVDLEQSPNAQKNPYGADVWSLAGNPKDDDIAVSANALDGVDLWMDPLLDRAIFLSDHLVRALKEANLTSRFGLRKCRII